MIIENISPTSYSISAVNTADDTQIQPLVDLINDGGQLSWTLTPSRLVGKLGSNGTLIGLYNQGTAVGVIGIKEMTLDGIKGGEIGYLYIDPEHRSLQNAIKLYNEALDHASKYAFLVASTITTNKQVNTLLSRSSKISLILTAKSPYSSNKLNYWLANDNSGAFTHDEIAELLHTEYGDNQINEAVDSLPTISFNEIHKAPQVFHTFIQQSAMRNPIIEIDNPDSVIQIFFGRRSGLPTTPNTIYVGNKFLNKTQQYQTVLSKIPTVKTFSSPDGIDGDFIAKQVAGHRQEGQLKNQIPDNPDDYIFQPLLNIIKEYRVIVYYMNGSYYVSGVYEKTGSNVSLKSITSGEIYSVASKMAVTACELIGYGFSGVDLALVEQSDNLNENVIGNMASHLGRLHGKTSRRNLDSTERLVFLEANTIPSMQNPMIMTEAIKHIMSNKK